MFARVRGKREVVNELPYVDITSFLKRSLLNWAVPCPGDGCPHPGASASWGGRRPWICPTAVEGRRGPLCPGLKSMQVLCGTLAVRCSRFLHKPSIGASGEPLGHPMGLSAGFSSPFFMFL